MTLSTVKRILDRLENDPTLRDRLSSALSDEQRRRIFRELGFDITSGRPGRTRSVGAGLALVHPGLTS